MHVGLLLLLAVLIQTVTLGARADQPQRTITIHSKKFTFEPAEITLKKGETVRVILLADDVPHGLAVPALDLHLDATKDKPAEASVTPITVGDFPGKCSRFCGSGHRDMHFAVHVTE